MIRFGTNIVLIKIIEVLYFHNKEEVYIVVPHILISNALDISQTSYSFSEVKINDDIKTHTGNIMCGKTCTSVAKNATQIM